MPLRALPAFLGLLLLVTAAHAQEEAAPEDAAQGETNPDAAVETDAAAELSPAEERGRQVFLAASCAGCHTDPDEGTFLAGGRAISSPFGTFYSPNITPHPENGLGDWSEADFARALREGRMPAGSPYYPAFPYTSYTGMSDADVSDLWAYMQTLEPADQANREHDLSFPFGFRFLLEPWRLLFFEEGRFAADSALSEEEARGAYLVEVLGHCSECHTPRNRLGALEQDRAFAGTSTGPDGRRVANITPHEDGLADWSAGDIAYYLETGFTPEFDYAGGAMVEVIETSTSQLNDADRQAMAAYLKSLPPLPRE